ncbi:MAG: hypothetical protein IIB66_03990 [Proteobacteria bacterium]|nr:hypothetical protein [Pseudomonadota bacterium]
MRIGMKGLGALFGVVMLAGPAFGQGQGTGDKIDEFHGNATNERDSGNGVIPSLSPGPWICSSECTDDTTAGGSIGEFITGADFANANDRDLEEGDGPNFSEPYDHGGIGRDTGEP